MIRPRVVAAAILSVLCLFSAGPASAQPTTIVSRASNGVQGDEGSACASISADGRYIAFESDASNLVAGDTNGAPDVFVHDRFTGRTVRVSVASDGTQGLGGLFGPDSRRPAISADGRFVAFSSDATNLVAGDTNALFDVFLHDRDADEDGIFDEPGAVSTSRMDVASDGSQAVNPCAIGYCVGGDYAAISGDGRFVAFHSDAANLVANDTNEGRDVFVHDRLTGETARVSVASDGSQSTGVFLNSQFPALNWNGHFVAFQSLATNLVADDTNEAGDVFVHHRPTGRTTRVSVATGGIEANGFSFRSSISGNGRLVAFGSIATNLVPDDTNDEGDAFVHDRRTLQTRRVSIRSDGTETGGADAFDRPAISGNGRIVAFSSNAGDIVPNDTNELLDVFAYDLPTGVVERVSVATDGSQAMFADGGSQSPAVDGRGRFIAFDADTPDLVMPDTNDFVRDVFTRRRQ